jgi:small redox-active disulfide protein 2
MPWPPPDYPEYVAIPNEEFPMKKLQILGTGCPKCHKLAENTKAAADALGVAYELQKVTQIDQIMKFGVMFTPALAVDGVVKVSGKVPGVEAIKAMLA